MKNSFKTIRIAALLLVLAVFGTVGYNIFVKPQMVKPNEPVVNKTDEKITPPDPLMVETGPYMEEAFLAIVKNWDDKELMKRATSYLAAMEAKQKRTPEFFAIFKHIGGLKIHKGCQFLTSNNEEIPFADTSIAPKINIAYNCAADFEKGPARIEFVLSKENDKWGISTYRVFSPFIEDYAKSLKKPTSELENQLQNDAPSKKE